MKRYLLLSILFCFGNIESFSSLDQARLYAATIPEYPVSDSDNLETPDFTTLYNSLQPSWWRRLAHSIGITKKSYWNPASVLPLLKKVHKNYESIKKPEDKHITVNPKTKLIVVGGLHGAFHSALKILTDLQQKDLISNTLLLKPNTYFIIIGNAIDYSAYSLETIALLLALMDKNPEQVIYLAGFHELKKAWHDYGLKKEITQRVPGDEQNITTAIDSLVSVLPQRLWVTLLPSKEQLLFASQAPENNYQVLVTGDEALKNYANERGLYKKISSMEQITWHVVSSPVKLYRLRYRFFYDAYADIQLNETLLKSTIALYYTTGPVPFTHGNTYSLASGNLLIRGLDVPAITPPRGTLTIDQLRQKIETLIEQVHILSEQVTIIRKQIPPTKVPPLVMTPIDLLTRLASEDVTHEELQEAVNQVELLYNALTKEVDSLIRNAEKQGLTTEVPEPPTKADNVIVLGSSLDVSKSAKGLGIPFRSGMALKVNKLNQEGGIHGKRVQIIFLDDGYLPFVARQNVETLLHKYHTPYILSPVGSPTLLASIDLIKNKKILVLFPQSGSPVFRDPNLTHIINMRASFFDEGRVLTNYVLQNFFPKNFVFFYQNDEFGISTLKGGRQALKDADVAPATEISYLANTTYFKGAAQKIRQANPDAIAFFAIGPAVLQLIRDLGVEFLANKVLYAVSSVGDVATMKVLKDRGLQIIVGQVVPDPETSELEIVQEYQNELKKQGLTPTVFSLESYINASVTFDVMKNINEPITMQKIVDYFEAMKNYTFKGISLNFNPKTRSLARYLWINSGEGPWIEKNLDQPGASDESA